MLNEIAIENVAVIEKASASFAGGFTVLTGETGAGKSILIDSINAIMGNRTSRDIVRNGTARARVTAVFQDIPAATQAFLDDAGYTPEADLLLQRDISSDGKSTCRVNGTPATAGILKDICDSLVNIHGQHDNQALLDPGRHIEVIDVYAKNDTLLQEYVAAYQALMDTRRQIKTLDVDETQKKRRLELLRYEVDELEAAALSAGEEEELAGRRDVIRNSQKIILALQGAHHALSGGDEDIGADTLLASASQQLQAISEYSDAFAEVSGTLTELYYSASETAADVLRLLNQNEDMDTDPEAIEARLDQIYRLKNKYGGSVDAALAYLEQAQAELQAIELSDESLVELQAQAAVQEKKAAALADALTDARLSAFERLKSDISDALAFLNMPGVSLALKHETEGLGPGGQDSMVFLIATNPGEPPKPLSKIASGGELARIMLAIKSNLAENDNMQTVIYDEIDTGISGLAAGRIGQLLRRTAKGRQVICVTHTAQVAAHAHQHLLIEKKVADDRTYTMIRELDAAERVDELARIISGDQLTETARANAREMLSLAQKAENT